MNRKTGNHNHAIVISLRQAAITACVFVGALALAVLAFISLELMGMLAGFMAICGFIALEIRRRQNWELASSFKFKNMADNHDALSRSVARNKHDISVLKDSVAALAQEMPPAGAQAPQQEHGEEFAFLKRLSETVEKMDESPRAAKPGMAKTQAPEPRPITEEAEETYRQSPLAANDDPFSEYASLSDMVVQELLHSAVRQGRIDVFAQAVARLPSRKAAAYELFARIRARPGLYIPASRYMDVARQDKLTADIDALLLNACLKSIMTRAKDDQAARFYINIAPSSLKKPKFINTLLAFVAQNKTMAKTLAFEMPAVDFSKLSADTLKIMEGLARLGCGFSIDHAENLEFDIRLLQKLNIRTIKMPAATIIAHSRTELMFTDLWRLKNKLEANGVAVIADRIEREEDLKEILDLNFNFGQGFLLGKPDLLGAHRPFAHAKTYAKRQGVRETFS